jgi:hypothetical protein
MTNDCIPFYDDSEQITARASVDVTGKRFVAVSGNRSGGNVTAAPAAAGARALGVAGFDAPAGGVFTVLKLDGQILPVVADGAITANDEIVVGANGKAKSLAAATGVHVVGFALNGALDGADAQICFRPTRYVP